MALTCSLDLATSASAHEVARSLIATGLFGEQVTAERLVEEGAATTNGTWLRAFAVSPRPSHPIVTDLGFTPTTSVAFQLAKDHAVPKQQDDVVRMTSAVLRRVTGDAVLHRDLEHIWLLRRDELVSVSEEDTWWPAERLALVGLPYQRKSHTFADE